jgi:branched-chain amino acid transport system ATP-binding protein
MAKTMKPLLERAMAKRADSIEHKIDYLEGTIQIRKDHLEAGRSRVLDKMKDRQKKEIRALELSMMDPKDYAEVVTEDVQRIIEEKRSLARRAAAQSAKRALKRHPIWRASITEKLETKQDAIDIRYDALKKKHIEKAASRHDAINPKDASARLEALRKSHQEALDAKSSALESEDGKTLEAFKEKQNKAIRAAREKLEKLNAKIKTSDDQRQDETETIAPDSILSVSNLTMMFGGLKAVNDLSFDVRKGEVFGLIGPNGAGKTTIFNCVTQFYKSYEGTMLYRNRKGHVERLGDFKVHDVIREGIVRTFQNVELVFELTVLENMLVGAHTMYRTGFFHHIIHSGRMRREEEIVHAKALEILDTLGLRPFKDAYPLGLPYGILKRIELARTLMAKPNMIILDEPAAGLNDTETRELAQTIRRIRDTYDVTIFLVEHDMTLVMDVCDTICAINFGKKLAIGSPQSIKNNKDVQEAYLGGE